MTEADLKALEAVRKRFAPHRLRMARELEGISQGDLGGAAKVSAAAVSQYERGSAVPSTEVIAAFARRLKVSAEFFALRDLAIETPAFFRSLRSAPSVERKRARHFVQLVHELVRELESDVRLPTVDLPRRPVDPAAADIAGPEEAAAEVRRAWAVRPGPIDNMVRLVERHGIVVTRLGSGHHEIDAFSVPLPERPVIVMSAAKGKRDRSRLDVAHELGHLVMHQPGQPTKSIERQAQAFGAAFLMPADDIRDELPNDLDWNRLVVLKGRWQVSLAALLYRCKTLEVFESESTYVQGMKIMSARGWRRHEPADLGDPESPVLLEKMMEVAGVTVVDLASRTAIPLHLLRDVLDLAADDRPEVVI